MSDTTVIVGANLAGGRAAAALREQGFGGRIFLIGEEAEPPYERPPLSKDLLWAESGLPDNLYIHGESFYMQQRIELCLSQRVAKLDLPRRRIVLADENVLPADKILLCTGGRARRLSCPGTDLDGVFYMRSLADACALQTRLRAGTRVVIIGMGVIGAEVAASAIRRGCEVTAIEPLGAPMERVLGTHFGQWLAEQHTRRGVRLMLKTSVQRLNGTCGAVQEVLTSQGQRVRADLVVVGIGIEPADELALAAGLGVSNGVTVDRQCRTSSPLVWAAGDVASQPDFFETGRHTRLETFQNAQEQGVAAAASMMGKPVNYLHPPWFWTDQYDLNIQACGRFGSNATRIARGADTERFTIFFLRAGVVEGLVTVNRPQDMSIGRRMVQRRMPANREELANESIPLRSLLRTPEEQAGHQSTSGHLVG